MQTSRANLYVFMHFQSSLSLCMDSIHTPPYYKASALRESYPGGSVGRSEPQTQPGAANGLYCTYTA